MAIDGRFRVRPAILKVELPDAISVAPAVAEPA
jgi:hypothetical protein